MKLNKPRRLDLVNYLGELGMVHAGIFVCIQMQLEAM